MIGSDDMPQRAVPTLDASARRGTLQLKRDDSPDYFLAVLDDGKVAGRIFKSKSAPRELPWCWTISFFERRGEGPHQGFEPTQQQAESVFRSAWDATCSAPHEISR